MRALELVRGVLAGFAARLAAARSRRREFNCGDCDRWERCGLSPSDRCYIRAAALGRHNRRLPSFYLLHW